MGTETETKLLAGFRRAQILFYISMIGGASSILGIGMWVGTIQTRQDESTRRIGGIEEEQLRRHDRIYQVDVVRAEVTAIREDVAQIKGDVKELLRAK